MLTVHGAQAAPSLKDRLQLWTSGSQGADLSIPQLLAALQRTFLLLQAQKCALSQFSLCYPCTWPHSHSPLFGQCCLPACMDAIQQGAWSPAWVLVCLNTGLHQPALLRSMALYRDGIQQHQLLRFQAAVRQLQTSYAIDTAPPEPPSRGDNLPGPSPLLHASHASLQQAGGPQLQLLKEQTGLADAISVEARADSVAAQLQGAAPLLRSLQASTLRRPRDAPSRSVLGPAPGEAETSHASWRDDAAAASSKQAPQGGISGADGDAGAEQLVHEARTDALPMVADHAEPGASLRKGSGVGEQSQEEELTATAAFTVTGGLMPTAQPTSSHQQGAVGSSLLSASLADRAAAASAKPADAEGPGNCLPASDAGTAPMHPLQPKGSDPAQSARPPARPQDADGPHSMMSAAHPPTGPSDAPTPDSPPPARDPAAAAAVPSGAVSSPALITFSPLPSEYRSRDAPLHADAGSEPEQGLSMGLLWGEQGPSDAAPAPAPKPGLVHGLAGDGQQEAACSEAAGGSLVGLAAQPAAAAAEAGAPDVPVQPGAAGVPEAAPTRAVIAEQGPAPGVRAGTPSAGHAEPAYDSLTSSSSQYTGQSGTTNPARPASAAAAAAPEPAAEERACVPQEGYASDLMQDCHEAELLSLEGQNGLPPPAAAAAPDAVSPGPACCCSPARLPVVQPPVVRCCATGGKARVLTSPHTDEPHAACGLPLGSPRQPVARTWWLSMQGPPQSLSCQTPQELPACVTGPPSSQGAANELPVPPPAGSSGRGQVQAAASASCDAPRAAATAAQVPRPHVRSLL